MMRAENGCEWGTDERGAFHATTIAVSNGRASGCAAQPGDESVGGNKARSAACERSVRARQHASHLVQSASPCRLPERADFGACFGVWGGRPPPRFGPPKWQ